MQEQSQVAKPSPHAWIKLLFVVWGGFSGLYAVQVLAVAQSSIHEIEVGVALIVAALSFGVAGVIHAIDYLTSCTVSQHSLIAADAQIEETEQQ